MTTSSDPTLALSAGGESLPLHRKLGLGMVGLGVLLVLIALTGAGSYGPARVLATAVGLMVAGLVLERGSPFGTANGSRAARGALAMMGAGATAGLLAVAGILTVFPAGVFWLSTGLVCIGTVLYARQRYGQGVGGIQNDGVMQSGLTSRGAAAWVLAIIMTGFYVLLYWFPSTLEGLIRTMDPLAWMLRGSPADQWFLYGTLYSLAVAVMGVRAIYRYRHSRYHVVRTFSVMFFQGVMAYIVPQLLVRLNQPEFYFTYFWPLKPEYLWPGDYGFGWILADGGRLGVFMVFWGAVMTVVGTPVLTYFFGKRWYCSWVCGCGCLAETMGDPFRHLADTSRKAWQIERWMIHGVLVFVVLASLAIWGNSMSGGAILGSASGPLARVYGFVIGSVFAGVIGVGFYPLMGARVWCRFGCPMAAVLGILQKYVSRFRITTNGGQCISCGNCSTYCEMGIDVRWYAQRGQNIVRASCVGCGMCSSVCPRGVLNLENGPTAGRYNGPVLVSADDVDVMTEDWRSAAGFGD